LTKLYAHNIVYKKIFSLLFLLLYNFYKLEILNDKILKSDNDQLSHSKCLTENAAEFGLPPKNLRVCLSDIDSIYEEITGIG